MRLLIGGTPTGTLKHISAATYAAQCGMLCSWADGAHPRRAAALGAPWALDNFAYSGLDAVKFERSLDKYADVPGCLFVVSPDVVGNAVATWANFEQWHDPIKALGYPLALAAQNGLEAMSLDWAAFDALFIGGDDTFKLGAFVAELVREAHTRGKWVHMGRVNSIGRWQYAQMIGCDSVDGTGYVIERKRILEPLAVKDNQQTAFWEGLLW